MCTAKHNKNNCLFLQELKYAAQNFCLPPLVRRVIAQTLLFLVSVV